MKGLWGSLVALKVWDLSTPVQIRAAPFYKMPTKSKKSRSAGRFGARYGKKVRDRLVKVEDKQRKKQPSPFHPNGEAKRIAVGIWKCKKTGKVFANNAYYLD